MAPGAGAAPVDQRMMTWNMQKGATIERWESVQGMASSWDVIALQEVPADAPTGAGEPRYVGPDNSVEEYQWRVARGDGGLRYLYLLRQPSQNLATSWTTWVSDVVTANWAAGRGVNRGSGHWPVQFTNPNAARHYSTITSDVNEARVTALGNPDRDSGDVRMRAAPHRDSDPERFPRHQPVSRGLGRLEGPRRARQPSNSGRRRRSCWCTAPVRTR